MTIGSLFSGIGGLELGLERTGLGPVLWQVEIDPFCRRVLGKHWPEAERFKDVREVGADTLAPVDLICGGFPCQDISSAGKGAGLAGSRSGLWYEFARVAAALRPTWVVVENVASGAQRWVDAVVAGLEGLDYETLPFPLSAADVGAPHLRRRVFIVAHTHRHREPVRAIDEEVAELPEDARQPRDITDANGSGLQGAVRSQESAGGPGRPWSKDTMPKPALCRVDDGPAAWVDRNAALGNAVVPQCAEVIGWVIRELQA